MDREMNTTTMISEIEKILPPVQKREWILRKKKTQQDVFVKHIAPDNGQFQRRQRSQGEIF